MMAALRARRDAFLGRGEAAVTIPVMDGALRPNSLLDGARVVQSVAAPDDLVVCGGAVLVSSRTTVLSQQAVVAAFDADVSCLAGDPAGRLAVGLDDGRVMLRRGDEWTAVASGGTCPTAMAFTADALLVAHGSARHPPSRWRHDLMDRGSSGSVWRVPLEGGAPDLLATGRDGARTSRGKRPYEGNRRMRPWTDSSSGRWPPPFPTPLWHGVRDVRERGGCSCSCLTLMTAN